VANQDEVCLEEIIFYIRLAQGHEPVDCSDAKLVMTYTNLRGHAVIYSNQFTNGTITTIKAVNGDSDSLLEIGEKFQVCVNFRNILSDDVKPVLADHRDVYGRPYETLRLELRPIVGATLTIEKEIPAVNAPVMSLK
jgi:archaellin